LNSTSSQQLLFLATALSLKREREKKIQQDEPQFTAISQESGHLSSKNNRTKAISQERKATKQQERPDCATNHSSIYQLQNCSPLLKNDVLQAYTLQ